MSDWKVKYKLLDVLFSSCGIVVPVLEENNVKKKGNMHTKVDGSTQRMLAPNYTIHLEIEMKVKIPS